MGRLIFRPGYASTNDGKLRVFLCQRALSLIYGIPLDHPQVVIDNDHSMKEEEGDIIIRPLFIPKSVAPANAEAEITR